MSMLLPEGKSIVYKQLMCVDMCSLPCAGCPVAVGNLWDVTDRDIDRFAMALLEKWLGKHASSESAGSGAAQLGRGEASPRTEGKVCVSASVSQSRSVCRLPHLIGAAPVCYGIPTAIRLQAPEA